MLEASRKRISELCGPGDLVLDVGGWAEPLARADWVIDLMPHQTRGLYGSPDPDSERFSAETWVQRDICDREPWPFADDQFDFVVCSHTLEDVRDPVWVCSELRRVARAGYLEVPARSEEQTPGVHGPWVGWSHHHWLADVSETGIELVAKPHLLHGRREFWVDPDWWRERGPAERVGTLFWEDSFDFGERIFYVPEELHAYLDGVFERYRAPRAPEQEQGGMRQRLSKLAAQLGREPKGPSQHPSSRGSRR